MLVEVGEVMVGYSSGKWSSRQFRGYGKMLWQHAVDGYVFSLGCVGLKQPGVQSAIMPLSHAIMGHALMLLE